MPNNFAKRYITINPPSYTFHPQPNGKLHVCPSCITDCPIQTSPFWAAVFQPFPVVLKGHLWGTPAARRKHPCGPMPAIFSRRCHSWLSRRSFLTTLSSVPASGVNSGNQAADSYWVTVFAREVGRLSIKHMENLGIVGYLLTWWCFIMMFDFPYGTSTMTRKCWKSLAYPRQQGLAFFEEMPTARVDKDVVTYNSALSCFEKGSLADGTVFFRAWNWAMVVLPCFINSLSSKCSFPLLSHDGLSKGNRNCS